jgi:predicted HicB family RNase H-like nuclease
VELCEKISGRGLAVSLREMGETNYTLVVPYALTMARPLAIDPKGKAPGEVVTLRVSPQQREALSKKAEKENTSVAELVRKILREAGFS